MNLPKEFETYTLKLFGEERYALFLKGLDQDSPTSIRLNTFKLKENEAISETLIPQQIPWCKEGYYLNERPNFTFDPLLHAGIYYVQEA